MNNSYVKHNQHTQPTLLKKKSIILKHKTGCDTKIGNLQREFQIIKPYNSLILLFFQWVYNILEHKKESDRILYEDPDKETGFIILPDLKWDGKQVEELYLTAICHARNLKSIRDLNASHLPLLKKILEKGMVSDTNFSCEESPLFLQCVHKLS